MCLVGWGEGILSFLTLEIGLNNAYDIYRDDVFNVRCSLFMSCSFLCLLFQVVSYSELSCVSSCDAVCSQRPPVLPI